MPLWTNHSRGKWKNLPGA